jgi:hypothetical protein
MQKTQTIIASSNRDESNAQVTTWQTKVTKGKLEWSPMCPLWWKSSCDLRRMYGLCKISAQKRQPRLQQRHQFSRNCHMRCLQERNCCTIGIQLHFSEYWGEGNIWKARKKKTNSRETYRESLRQLYGYPVSWDVWLLSTQWCDSTTSFFQRPFRNINVYKMSARTSLERCSERSN